MRKHLYDILAEKWLRPNGNTIWIISDPHFNDPMSKKYRHSYPGDEEVVRRINSKVGKNDTIIFLGDIGDVSFIKKIKGYKILIMGNHEKGASNYKREIESKEYFNGETGAILYREIISDNHLFDEVYEGPIMINDRVILSHEPIPVLEFMFNLHGHTHDLPYQYDDRHLNFCAEAIDYIPINMLNLFKNGLLKNTKSIHQTTIEGAVERKAKRTRKESE